MKIPAIALLACLLSACTITMDNSAPGPSRQAKICFQSATGTESDWASGLASCRAALASRLSDDDRAATLINSGVIEYFMQEPAAALADFQASVVVKPSLGDGYVDVGIMLGIQKRYPEALAALDKAIASGAEHLQFAYYNRGIAKEYVSDIAGAYYDYKQALAIDPDYVLAAEQLRRFRVIPRVAPAHPV